MTYDVLMIAPAVAVSAVLAYLILRFRLAENDIKSVLTTLVLATVAVVVGVFYLLGWDIYEGAGYGIVGSIVVAAMLRIRYNTILKKKKRQREKMAQGGDTYGTNDR